MFFPPVCIHSSLSQEYLSGQIKKSSEEQKVEEHYAELCMLEDGNQDMPYMYHFFVCD